MSKSQLGQDLKVLKFYNNKKNGFFVEIGASDGINLSNTYLLEKEYDWKGVCVEPIPYNYEKLINPLNCALLANLPKKENDVSYTKAIAHKNGWCFYIPLPTTTSLGYIFNKDITSVEEAEDDFKKTFKIKKINQVFPFKQYVAKSPIINNRVLLNGNKLFFLEPLEATAMSSYLQCTRFYYDYMFNNFKKEITNELIKDHITKVQDFILWHYSKGSKYKTSFWKHGKILWKKHKKENIQKIIKTVKKMSNEDISKSIQSNFNYAQWKEWNFKIWFDGIEKNIK